MAAHLVKWDQDWSDYQNGIYLWRLGRWRHRE